MALHHRRHSLNNHPDTMCDAKYKVLLLGESAVGKTALMLRFVDDRYPTGFISTLGVDFQSKTVEIDSSLIKLQIWDTAGQERFCSLTRTYFNGAQGVILVYDITDRESFFRVRNWMEEIDKNVSDLRVNKILVGNKCDCALHQRKVSYEQGAQLADEYGMEFYETSAKLSLNVETVFVTLANDIHQRLINDSKHLAMELKRAKQRRRKSFHFLSQLTSSSSTTQSSSSSPSCC